MTLRPTLEIALEDQGMTRVNAVPASGDYGPPQPAIPLREARATLRLDAPRFGLFGMDAAAALSLSAMHDTEQLPGEYTSVRGRGIATLDAARRFSGGQLALSLLAAGLSNADGAPPQSLIYLGGPVSAPGYDFHSLAGARAVAAHAEWRVRVPFVPVPLGSWGRAPATATLAPFVHGAWVDGRGWYPSVGVGALTVFDLLRFDVARGTRDGRWSFYFDVSRDFWGIL
jgi:hypothetical protein